MDAALSKEIWKRLSAGGSLDELQLNRTGGRFDLRGLATPEVSMRPEVRMPIAGVKRLSNLVEVRGAKWSLLDFSGCHLRSLRLFGAVIEDCVFDGAHCQDWRIWGTTVTGTSFRAADLRRAALGGVENGRRNCFRRVDFSRADFRQTVHGSADFTDCRFSGTRLSRVDFQGSVFEDCAFEGDLDEVLFYRQSYSANHHGVTLPANEMRNVDFRRARFRDVEFRELDMKEVIWPESSDHILVRDYPATLDRVLNELRSRSDLPARKVAAGLASNRKWAGRNQEVGVVSKLDLIAAGGDGAVDEFLRLAGAAATVLE